MDRSNHRSIAVTMMIFSVGAFAALALLVTIGDPAWLDDPVKQFFYGLRSPGLSTLMESITYLGNWQTVAVISLLLLAYDKTRIRYGVPVAAVALTSSLLNKLLKIWFQRPRPEDIPALIQEGGYAFPSGHSVTSMAVYGLLLYLVWNRMEDKRTASLLMALLALLICLIGPSRIYLGVHYPTDVLAGWAEGLFLLSLAVFVLNFLPNKGLQQDR